MGLGFRASGLWGLEVLVRVGFHICSRKCNSSHRPGLSTTYSALHVQKPLTLNPLTLMPTLQAARGRFGRPVQSSADVQSLGRYVVVLGFSCFALWGLGPFLVGFWRLAVPLEAAWRVTEIGVKVEGRVLGRGVALLREASKVRSLASGRGLSAASCASTVAPRLSHGAQA